jgi:hypothetical protein
MPLTSQPVYSDTKDTTRMYQRHANDAITMQTPKAHENTPYLLPGET